MTSGPPRARFLDGSVRIEGEAPRGIVPSTSPPPSQGGGKGRGGGGGHGRGHGGGHGRGATLDLGQFAEAFAVVSAGSNPSPIPGPAKASYDSVVLADNPAIYLKLNDASPGPAVDSSGNGHNIAIRGTPTFQAAKLFVNGSSSMTGSTGNWPAVGTTVAGLNANKQFSVECWMKTSAAAGSLYVFLSSDNSSGARYFQWRLEATTHQSLSFFDTGNDGFNAATATTQINTGQPLHLVATCDATTRTATLVNFYANGAQDGTTATVNMNAGLELATNNSGFAVGEIFSSGVDGTGISASIEAVALYTHILSPARVLAHYTAGTS